MDILDDLVPEFDVRERHERRVDVPPPAALARLLAVPAAPDPLVRLLFTLRGITSRGESIPTFLRRRLGAAELGRREHAVVYGTRGRLSIAVAFWAEPEGSEGSRLGTETRVVAGDRRTRLAFRAYWFVVRPFSGLIRRRWLRAAAR